MKKFPRWFWGSIVAFFTISWLAIPIATYIGDRAADVVLTIIIFGGVIYPLFAVSLFVTAWRKLKLDENEKIWAFLFVLIPLFAYLPLWFILGAY